MFTEIVGNPNVNVADLEKIAEIAHSHGIPFAADSTFTTPYLCRPIEFGADFVIHSATKFLAGHGTVMAVYGAYHLVPLLTEIDHGVENGRMPRSEGQRPHSPVKIGNLLLEKLTVPNRREKLKP